MRIAKLVGLAPLVATSWLGCEPTSGEMSGVAASGVAAACSASPSADRRAEVCRRWTCGHGAIGAATWRGDAKACVAGAIDDVARTHALRLVNTYRFLAGVPDVVIDAGWEEPAQRCALLAQANGKLSHEPPNDWACWSDLGARASAVSLIANRSAPVAIDPFIEDPGNEATMVHRRWLLGENIHRIALGSTNGFSCAVVDGREFEGPTSDRSEGAETLSTERSWVAWPPEGAVPLDALRRTNVDAIGWTIQSSTLDLDGASVEVAVDGALRPVRVSPLERTLGSLTALRFVPDGWSIDAGRRYDVRVAKGELNIGYAIEPVTCP